MTVVLLLLFGLGGSCPPDPSTSISDEAGPDQSVALGQVAILSGLAGSEGSPPYAYRWRQVSGPAQTMVPADGTSPLLAVTGLNIGTTVFELTITDSASQVHTDTATVTVDSLNPVLRLTTGVDDLVGTAGTDAFVAPVVVENSESFQTLNAGDEVDGGLGYNTLSAVLNGHPKISGSLAPTLKSIQALNVTDTANTTLDAAGMPDLQLVNEIGGAGLTVINNLQNVVSAALINSTGGLTLRFRSELLDDPTTMTIRWTLFNSSKAQLIVTSPSGNMSFRPILLDLSSVGPGPNSLIIVMTSLTSTTLRLTGDKDLHLEGTSYLNMGLTTLDASAFTGRLTMAAGLPAWYLPTGAPAVIGGTGDDVLIGGVTASINSGVATFANTADDTLVGGPGDDTIDGRGGVDTLTLGPGSDLVQITEARPDGADPKIVTDFDDTPGTGDRINIAASLVHLSGLDHFASSASVLNHSVKGDLNMSMVTSLVRVTSGTVPSFTDAASLNGVNLLAAVGGIARSPMPSGAVLMAVADPDGDVGIYLARSGTNSIVTAGTVTLIAVLQGPDVSLADLVFSNFSNQ